MFALGGFMMGCGDVPGGEAEPATDEATEAAEVVADAEVALNAELYAHGEGVFETLCSTCHTKEPPPNLAPPMLHVVGHYLQEYEDRPAAEEAIRNWVTNPNLEHSAMPEHAIERFGLMPAQPIPEDQAAAVAYYVLEMYEEEGGMGEMGGMGDMNGMESSDDRPGMGGMVMGGEGCGEMAEDRMGGEGCMAGEGGGGHQMRGMGDHQGGGMGAMGGRGMRRGMSDTAGVTGPRGNRR